MRSYAPRLPGAIPHTQGQAPGVLDHCRQAFQAAIREKRQVSSGLEGENAGFFGVRASKAFTFSGFDESTIFSKFLSERHFFFWHARCFSKDQQGPCGGRVMNALKKQIATIFVFGMFVCGMAGAAPVSTIWGNSAGDGLYQYDLTTGNLLQSFSPGTTFNVTWNGRGVVQVGNTLYLTNADDNNVYKMNATTGASEGVAFSIAGASGLSAIAYDGSNFWVADYSGSDKAYLYSPAGMLLKTISLANCTGYCDGLEYFNGKLIENRFDGGYGGPNQYDVYDTNGTLLMPAFFTSTSSASTGVAFDGTNFWTSNIFSGSLSEWNGTTGAFIKNLALQSPPYSFEIEDLSVNYSQVITGVPEPASWGMLGLGALLIGVFLGMRRRFD